jgi:hypothetical protein
MFLDEPMINTSARVALLGRLEFVICQPLIYDGHKSAKNWHGPRLGHFILGWTGILNSRTNRTPVMMPLPGDLSYALAFNKKALRICSF